MGETVTCHEWRDGFWDAYTMVPRTDGYCPICGTRLLPDGTTQEMVPGSDADALRERLAAMERDGYAPQGKVLVDEAELREVLDEYTTHVNCWDCQWEHECGYREKSRRSTWQECRQYLLAHFGLAPEPEAQP